jgi:hypothetical protein
LHSASHILYEPSARNSLLSDWDDSKLINL